MFDRINYLPRLAVKHYAPFAEDYRLQIQNSHDAAF